MKVIHLISGGDSGGAKSHVLRLLQHLNQTITAQLVCFRDGPFAEEARAMGIPTMICGGNNIPHLRRELAAYIQQGGYQLIHCHGSRANMIGALLRGPTGLPVVSTVHSDYKLDYMGRPFARLTFGAINAWALRHLDYRIGVSDAMVDLLIDRGFPPDRFYAIYNGIDFTPAPSQGDRLAYLRGLGADVEENSVVVGIAARLNPVKDMSTLIRGFAEGHKSCPRLRLVIAGDGEERQKLEDLAKELGVEKEVTFAGWISGGMDRFYSTLDINALTSLSETFPYALTEGARFHLATVATAVGGIPYLIDQDVNGYLFTPGDWQTLGRYLAALGNGDALRREMGEKLYEKASAKFSIQSTVDTQLHIYEEIIRRHNRPKRDRDGVVICGAYGRGNAGDDAILEAILQEMRSIDPDMPITVLTKDPKATRLTYRVRTAGRMDVGTWKKAMRHAGLYINGGGSLMQDVTSTRSIWYYCYTLYAAKKRGCKVMMYGCGIGPINRPGNRRMAARTIDASVDRITLRDDNSRALLAEMGVTRPDIRVSADPTIILMPAPREIVNIALEQSGIDPNGKYIGFGLRNWKGLDTALPEIAAAANYAYEKHGLTPVFVPIEFPSDLMPAERVGALLHCPWHAVRTRQPIEVTIGILSRMKTVVGIRLHSLMFSAGQGVPVVGMSYDIKVDGFLKYIGSRTCLQLSSVKAEPLCRLIDECVSGALDNEVHRTAEMLRERESENVKGAAKLLNISEN